MKSNWVSESDFNKDGQTEIHKLIWDTDINHMHCKRKYTPRQRGTLSSITYDWVLIECEFCNQNGSINVIAFGLIALYIDINSFFMYVIFLLALLFTIAFLWILVNLVCCHLLSWHCAVCTHIVQFKFQPQANFPSKMQPNFTIHEHKMHHVLITWFEQIDHHYR